MAVKVPGSSENTVGAVTDIAGGTGQGNVAAGDGTGGIGDVSGAVGVQGDAGGAGNVVVPEDNTAVTAGGVDGDRGSCNVTSEGDVVVIEYLEGIASRGGSERSSTGIADVDVSGAGSIGG